MFICKEIVFIDPLPKCNFVKIGFLCCNYSIHRDGRFCKPFFKKNDPMGKTLLKFYKLSEYFWRFLTLEGDTSRGGRKRREGIFGKKGEIVTIGSIPYIISTLR